MEKIKASELFLAKLKSSKKDVIFLQFVNINVISPTKQLCHEPVALPINYYKKNNMSAFNSTLLYIFF